MTRTLSLRRERPAEPASVWRCLTEADLFAQWFAPPVRPHEAMGFHAGWGSCAEQLGNIAATL
ncbi:MAG: hypothetical protein AAGH70_02020 [Pseudomonadota bacterium]